MTSAKSNLILLTILLALTGCKIPFTMHPKMASSGLEELSSERCQECHTVIYDEWLNSPHAKAYSNQFFKELTNDYQVTACLKCHAPETAFTNEPQMRPVQIMEGVHCQTCHLRDGKLQGPTDQHLPFDIHPIQEKNDLYLRSDLCGNCHQKTFEEYTQSAATEKTCQDCHMPEVRRTIIDNRPWVWTKKEFKFRRHTFEVKSADTLKNDLHLTLALKSQNPPTGQITIENASIPHNIPTGTYGYHALLLTINLLNDLGETDEKQSIYFTQELKTSIKHGEKRVIDFEFEDEHQFPWGVQAILTKDSLTHDQIKVLSETVRLYQ